MNIEHLKLFVRLASTHNISSAGQELGLFPAVASSHLSKLEEGLGDGDLPGRVRLPAMGVDPDASELGAG